MLIESLRDYQIKALDELRDGVRKGHRSQILVAPTGAGKCLAKDTPILMANGRIIPVQFVFPQDKIMGDDGTPRTVLSIARGREKMFRVVPIKGDPYVVNASHILSLRKTFGTDGMVLSDGTKIPKDADVVNVRADVFFASNQTVKHNLKGWRCAGVQRFDRLESDLPIPPYILGAWIGDGTAKSPAISKYPCNMINEWIAYGESIGCSISTTYSYNGCPTHTLKSHEKTNQFTKHLKNLHVFKNKHIPDIYKYADIKDRLEILAGMIDTDGSIDKSGCDWISKYEHLANDFVFIARSCGFSAYVSKQRKGIKSLGFSSDYWRVSLTGDLDRIPTRDKIFPVRNQKKRHLVTGITLEELPEDDYYGFEIDGNRLFCLGDFTVTHNTVSASYLLNEARAKQNVAWFICDRVSLVDQTSTTLDRYGVPHGVIQADHWRWRPYEYVQVISAQTLARRKIDNEPKLIVIDECHTVFKSVADAIDKYPQAVVVGLTATPFTKGLSKIFSNVVNSTTTDKLINDGWLVPVKMFVAKSEMDMRGAAVKFDGEWAEKDMEKQGVEIVGDIVSEWIEATNKHFNGPVKTIVFSATVAHGEELCREFAQRGYNFQQISYKDGNNERRRELIDEFRKPDSDIIGLISCEALAKGFDVTDIKIGVCARPYRKSLSGHIQQMGRVMRPHQGKDFAVWLCLARGSRVLTDRGLVPIEKVTKDHKIWDGCNFITHGGAVCNGIRKVITYQGLTATPNHLVHTKDGWRTFGECAEKQIVITQTGLGWSPIRIGGDRGSSRYVVGEKGKQKTPRHMRVRDLFQQIGDFFSQPDWSKDQRLQELQPAGPGLSRLALFESSSHEGKVLQPEKRSVSTLRRERNRVQVSWGKSRDHLDHEQLGYTGIRNQARSWLRTTRSNRYKWALRAWKFALGLYQTKSVQQKGPEVGGTHAPLQDEKPRNKIFGQYIAKVFRNRHDRRPDHREVPQTIVETEREVWDILNAGPHNRFTCEGLLVHNCHAGNLTRFWEDQVEVFAHGVQELEDGKLDAKVRKEPTEKEKAEIKCTACGYMFRGRVCPSCGAERRSASNVLNTAGQMVEFGGTKSSDWMSDKRLVWWEIVQISKDRKRGDLAAAERFAKAQYKNLTGDWPKWKFHEAIFVEPRMVTQNKIKQQVIKYAKSKFGRRLV